MSFFSGNLARACGVIAIFVSTSGGLHAAEVTIIRTSAQSGTEPKYVAQTQQGKSAIIGLCIDINRAIERVDPSIRFDGDRNWQPTTRLEAEMAGGSLDAACGLSRTTERESKFVYIDPPLFSVKYFLVARADDEVQVNNWDDIRRLGGDGAILMVHGFGPVARLKELGGLVIDDGATDPKTNLLKLLAGRGRFYYHRSPGIRTEIRKAGVEGKVRILPVVMDRRMFHMVLGKSVAADAIERVRKAIVTLESSGELRRLVDKWFEE